MTRQAFSHSSLAICFYAQVIMCILGVSGALNRAAVLGLMPCAKCTMREAQHWKGHLAGRVLLEGSQSCSWSLTVTSRSVVSPAAIHGGTANRRSPGGMVPV